MPYTTKIYGPTQSKYDMKYKSQLNVMTYKPLKIIKKILLGFLNTLLLSDLLEKGQKYKDNTIIIK